MKKTIKQLRDERAMSAILYKGILRNICLAMSSYGKSIDYDEIKILTVQDVATVEFFNSTKSLEELKSLA